jgi:hypothetical protein
MARPFIWMSKAYLIEIFATWLAFAAAPLIMLSDIFGPMTSTAKGAYGTTFSMAF